MKGSEAHNSCSSGSDMLAYLYNEMATDARDSFEVHLADCGTCIDDFADLSQSRYQVYEWKCIKFDPLPTPRLTIPSETATVSLFDKIRAAFALGPTFALGGVAAAILIAAIAGYAIFLGDPGETELAREAEPVEAPSTAVVVNPPSSVIDDLQATDEVTIREERPISAKVLTVAKPTARSPKPKAKPVRQPSRNDQIPVMSSIEDDEDDSLRLADIFDEIGASE